MAPIYRAALLQQRCPVEVSMQPQKSRLTLPEMARALGVTRATAERLVFRYADRLGAVERFGIVRSWPADDVETLRVLLAEEGRLRQRDA